MPNPYEVTTTLPPAPGRLRIYAIGAVAGALGYGMLIVALGVTTYLTHGGPAAADNLERVWKIHSELSLNTLLACIPNLVLAILVSIAVTKWLDADDSQSHWWMLVGLTVIGYVVVLLSADHWNLIPWTWPMELSNAVRSTLTLLFPMVALFVAKLRKRRTKRWNGVADQPFVQ